MFGVIFYVDFDRIRQHGGYVYYWVLGDYIKPVEGDLSYKGYHQGDCKLFRYKYLSYSDHKEPMGQGTGKNLTPRDKWTYPSPGSSGEINLKSVCNFAK